MDEKGMDAAIGGVLGLIGLIMIAVWPADALSVLKGGIAVGFVGVGVWRLARFAGVDWAAMGRQITAAMRANRAPAALGPPCPHCGAFTHTGAQFCLQCGGALPKSKTCVGCQTQNESDATFCGGCGQPLA
jgi:membrane protease subunit (stomatin/prohibitin family)